MKKDKITIEELKETFNIARKKVLEKNLQQFKEISEKNNGKLDPLSELAFNMQNMLAIADFEQAILEELGINE